MTNKERQAIYDKLDSLSYNAHPIMQTEYDVIADYVIDQRKEAVRGAVDRIKELLEIKDMKGHLYTSDGIKVKNALDKLLEDNK
jgi:hypothetical protein